MNPERGAKAIRSPRIEHGWEEWRILRESFSGRCCSCGKGVILTRDHIVPHSKGGSGRIENIQPLCRRCNQRKNDHTIDYRPMARAHGAGRMESMVTALERETGTHETPAMPAGEPETQTICVAEVQMHSGRRAGYVETLRTATNDLAYRVLYLDERGTIAVGHTFSDPNMAARIVVTMALKAQIAWGKSRA